LKEEKRTRKRKSRTDRKELMTKIRLGSRTNNNERRMHAAVSEAARLQCSPPPAFQLEHRNKPGAAVKRPHQLLSGKAPGQDADPSVRLTGGVADCGKRWWHALGAKSDKQEILFFAFTLRFIFLFFF
jgi:hypothetical protein